jgi:hypothetical protein
MADEPEVEGLEEPEDESTERAPQAGEPFNAGDRRQVRERAKTEKQKDQMRAAVLEALMRTPEGRELLGHILFKLCGIMVPTENAAYDTNAMHFREGQRAVGLTLQHLALQANKSLYIVLLGEHLN